MMESKDRNEKMLDALIKIAAEEAMLNELEGIPSCEELDKLYTPSPQFEKCMETIISGKRRPKQLRTAFKITGRIAAGFAVLFTISTVALLSVEASRNYIFNTLISWQEDHTEFNFTTDGEAELNYTLGYIPEGFFLESSDTGGNIRTDVYTDETGKQIIYQQYMAESTKSAIDNENKDYSIIDIGGMQAYFFERKLEDDENILLWQYKQYAFKIISNIESQEIIEIAKNIEKK